jgi:hypothetical protein
MLDRHVAIRHLFDWLAVKWRSRLPVDCCRRFVGIPAVALGTIALAILTPAPAASAAAAASATTIALFAILFALAFASLGGRAFAFLAEGFALGLHRLFAGTLLVCRGIVSIGGGVGTILAP